MIAIGDTLHIPSGQNKHLFVVILGPIAIESRGKIKQYILLNFSSIKPDDGHDTTCEIQPGEHPNITRPSYVVYRKAEIQREDDLMKAISQKNYTQSTPCSEELVNKILQGVKQSKLISREIKKIFQDNI
jgi:hypothetical protein